MQGMSPQVASTHRAWHPYKIIKYKVVVYLVSYIEIIKVK